MVYEKLGDYVLKLARVSRSVEDEAIQFFCTGGILRIRVHHDGVGVGILRYFNARVTEKHKPSVPLQYFFKYARAIELTVMGSWLHIDWEVDARRSRLSNMRQYFALSFYRISDNLDRLVHYLNRLPAIIKLPMKIEVDWVSSPHINHGSAYMGWQCVPFSVSLRDAKRILQSLIHLRYKPNCTFGKIITNDETHGEWRHRDDEPEEEVPEVQAYKDLLTSIIAGDADPESHWSSYPTFCLHSQIVPFVEAQLEEDFRPIVATWLDELRVARYHGNTESYVHHQEALMRWYRDEFWRILIPLEVHNVFVRLDGWVGSLEPATRDMSHEELEEQLIAVITVGDQQWNSLPALPTAQENEEYVIDDDGTIDEDGCLWELKEDIEDGSEDPNWIRQELQWASVDDSSEYSSE